MDPAAAMSATDLVHALRDRAIGVREVLAMHADRMEQAWRYRAVVDRRDPDELGAEADAAQRRLDGGEPAGRGPLLGVPFTVKDIVAVQGMALTAGSRLLAHHRARCDAAVVRRLRRAGAIPIAKTNCPEFGFGISTANDLHGTTVNPWGADLATGGSSGGEAVAVALGQSALGVGTDFGGSIRWPAQSLGVVGLRPTPGRTPRTGQLVGVGPSGVDGEAVLDPSSMQGFVQVPGFLARSVADLELALGATAITTGDETDRRDLLSTPSPLGPSAAVDLPAIDIGVADGLGIGPVGDDVLAAVEALGRELALGGLRVKQLPSVFEGCRQAYDHLRTFDDLAALTALAAGREEELSAGIRAALAASPGGAERAAGRANAWERAVSARAGGLAQLAVTPLVILPVAAGPSTGHDETMTIAGQVLQGFEIMAHCRAVSLLGAPVVSIPIDRSGAGLPLSVQIVGPPWAEDLVLALARHIEDLRGGCQLPPTSPKAD